MAADSLESKGATTTAHTVSANDAQTSHDATTCPVSSSDTTLSNLADSNPSLEDSLLSTDSSSQIPAVSVVLSPTLRSQDGARSSFATPVSSHISHTSPHSQHALTAPQQPPRKYMYVTLKTPVGSSYRLRIRPTDRLERIKIKVFAKTEIPLEQQQLIFNNQEMVGHFTTATQFGLNDGSTIHLVPKLQAGPLHNRASAQVSSSLRKESQMLETLATHFASFDTQQDIADGKLVQIVTRVNGRFVVLRFSRQGRGDEEQYDEDDDDETEDVEMGREPMRTQEGEDAVEGAADGVSDDVAAQLRDKETLAEKLAGIRARLLDKQATRPPRSRTPSTLDASSGRLATAHRLARRPIEAAPVTLDAQQRNSRGRCSSCTKKLGMVHFPCKCGLTFCESHRPSHAHACAYDYQGKE